jgi:hypothetical protein
MGSEQTPTYILMWKSRTTVHIMENKTQLGEYDGDSIIHFDLHYIEEWEFFFCIFDEINICIISSKVSLVSK